MNGMQQDFSWTRSGAEYERLYERLIAATAERSRAQIAVRGATAALPAAWTASELPCAGAPVSPKSTVPLWLNGSLRTMPLSSNDVARDLVFDVLELAAAHAG